MKAITVNKGELLSILKDNREKHQAIFLEAVEGYHKKVAEELQAHIDRVKAGKTYRIQIYFDAPENQTKAYDRVIGMLEMASETAIELSEQDYSNYVMDDWTWKRDFISKNSVYSATAMNLDGGSL